MYSTSKTLDVTLAPATQTKTNTLSAIPLAFFWPQLTYSLSGGLTPSESSTWTHNQKPNWITLACEQDSKQKKQQQSTS